MAKAQIRISREVVPDDNHDSLFLEQEGWEDRLQAYRNQEFGFVGVRAVAEIRVPYGRDWIVTKLASPGLWSIEDDSGEDYFAEVYSEERAQLIDMLDSLHDYELVN